MRVDVLLSTYDGERWLPAQLDSLLAQSHRDLRVLVRDDGSTDGTRDVLDSYRRLDPRLQWWAGENLGAAGSFLELLRRADGAPAAAFCDQDDVWVPDHLERGLTALAEIADRPALWCSDVLVCDEELRPLRRHAVVRRGPSFANALVENVAPGCATVLNAAAVALLARGRPQAPVMHDAWCYLVVAALGEVLHDPHPSVHYRMHAHNTVGLDGGVLAAQTARALRALRGPHVGAWSRQAADLRREYGEELPPASAAELAAFLEGRTRLGARLRYTVLGRAHRQRPLGTAAMRLLYLLGRI